MATVTGGRNYSGNSASSNIQGFQSIRVPYILTSNDVNNAYANVLVTWPSPFADTLYTISAAVQDLQNLVAGSMLVEDIINITPQGFTAVIVIDSEAIIAGNQLVIHAIAFHD